MHGAHSTLIVWLFRLLFFTADCLRHLWATAPDAHFSCTLIALHSRPARQLFTFTYI